MKPTEQEKKQQIETENSESTREKGRGKERLYDKIPLNYRQVDILVKILLGLLVVLIIVGVVRGIGL